MSSDTLILYWNLCGCLGVKEMADSVYVAHLKLVTGRNKLKWLCQWTK
jgi:hypothetical protein